ncbi:hypothetical protein MKEN_01492200 [Mycena kentingensis (nom. inval.)]|nr:hypothetical protein MKEN_01492200 [Mycena kentingensis (nom. inval.)]
MFSPVNAIYNAGSNYGEVIISGRSSPDILTIDGSMQYFQAIGFDRECLGQHKGTPQSANLGDGKGEVNETAVIRIRRGDAPVLGTCIESLTGGNHFRVFPQAGTNALFLATSAEEDLSEHHTIIPNGYDAGRDMLVEAATGIHHGFDAKHLKRYTYKTEVIIIEGLLNPGKQGINHDIAIDGRVAMLTVTINGDERASENANPSPGSQTQPGAAVPSARQGTTLRSSARRSTRPLWF